MDVLKARSQALGPHPPCISTATSWADATRALGKEVDMDGLYRHHGHLLVRAVRSAGKLKGIYKDLFPQDAIHYDWKFQGGANAEQTWPARSWAHYGPASYGPAYAMAQPGWLERPHWIPHTVHQTPTYPSCHEGREGNGIQTYGGVSFV